MADQTALKEFMDQATTLVGPILVYQGAPERRKQAKNVKEFRDIQAEMNSAMVLIKEHAPGFIADYEALKEGDSNIGKKVVKSGEESATLEDMVKVAEAFVPKKDPQPSASSQLVADEGKERTDAFKVALFGSGNSSDPGDPYGSGNSSDPGDPYGSGNSSETPAPTGRRRGKKAVTLGGPSSRGRAPARRRVKKETPAPAEDGGDSSFGNRRVKNETPAPTGTLGGSSESSVLTDHTLGGPSESVTPTPARSSSNDSNGSTV